MYVSEKWKLTKTDLSKWGKNLVVFLFPLLLVYFAQLTGFLQTHESLSLQGLVPTKVTLGAIELYALNALVDLIKKWSSGY